MSALAECINRDAISADRAEVSRSQLLESPAPAQFFPPNDTSVFVMTNDNAKNEILTYQRGFDGQFALGSRVATGVSAKALK
jgi:hypothetical protein